jgi:hypothetical protein
MKVEELLRRFRVLAKDTVDPYLWSDDHVADWLNDAQAQACIRGRLIREDELAEVCRIELTAGKHTYPLHPAAYEIICLRILRAVDRPRPVHLVSREWLDAERPGWREDDRAAELAIQDDTTLRIVGKVDAGDVLALECYRLPLKDLTADNDQASPEIHRGHHEHLIQWALHKAFSIPDSEGFDPDRSGLAERAFTAYFGPMPDSDLRRSTREDVQHYNRGVLM